MNTIWSDVRFAWRALRRAPGSTCAAALTLAVGIGACAAVFAVLYSVLLRPLPFRQAGRLVTLSNTIPASGVAAFPFSQPELFALRADAAAFEALAAYVPASLNLRDEGPAERVPGARVSANFFDVLGAPPLLGRAFDADADRPGAECDVVARHGYWVERLGGDVSALGRTLTIDAAPCRLIGVMPPDFRLPASADLWVPAVFPAASMGREGLGRQMYRVIGRLADGVTPEQASGIIGEAARRFYAEHPDFYSGNPWRIVMVPLRDQVVGDVGTTLAVLMAAVAAMFLITCANVAHLILSRLLGREREFVLRSALGAGRRRLATQVLTECVLISLAGSAAGLWLASQAV
ncbi:MAG TPA: ABC transporter permease, partial [Vicinamibacterales bacterium]|nr:ABC transporter permease [Vicinamibacterales bacterium]